MHNVEIPAARPYEMNLGGSTTRYGVNSKAIPANVIMSPRTVYTLATRTMTALLKQPQIQRDLGYANRSRTASGAMAGTSI